MGKGGPLTEEKIRQSLFYTLTNMLILSILNVYFCVMYIRKQEGDSKP